jgi:hypothetical protein
MLRIYEIMHGMPSNFNHHLPPHKAVLADGTLRDVPCVGTTVREIEEDTGLFVGGCPNCCGTFVYIFKSDEWMPEPEFEKMLHDSAGTMGNAIRSL